MNKKLMFIFILFVMTGVIFSQINIISPNQGDILKKGSTTLIKWTSSGCADPNVKINIFKDSIDQSNFVVQLTALLSDNAKAWTIPLTFTTGNYVLRIKTADNVCIKDSGVFRIEDPTPTTATIDKSSVLKLQKTIPGTILIPQGSVFLKAYSPMIGFLPGKCNEVQFSVGIKNTGNRTSGHTKLRLIIDGPPGEFDNFVLNGWVPCGSIKPGMSCNFTKTFTINTPGTYDFTFAVDPDNELKQFNQVTARISQGNPDLIVHISSSGFANLTLNRDITFFVKNQGRACSLPSVLRTYVEQNGVKTHNIPSLLPGTIYQIKRSENWLTVGSKKITANADYTNLVDEGKPQFENNNSDESSILVIPLWSTSPTGLHHPAPPGFFTNATIINK